ncbi:SagB family peptide dehydrogenase [Clostridium sp. MSJ-8]|uniref:SagB family peptide dehydrogenase n=1 Tax=Clostridium sp. MSJ-8 TaxID=2841510 RepID=UPI001C0ED1E0|nr:SagB family peptide dehydrogenase [Clostridium sp. MSJ-8]MBU5487319.1 SagB family peptide dehydrogenase [Clostridium sp. MSJ-8]
MGNFKIKGMLNQHLKIERDSNNLTNNNNAAIYSQILAGNFESYAYNYLLNLGFMRLSDVKSIGMYNEMNLAANISANKIYEEIKDEYTIKLPEKLVKVKKSVTNTLEERHSARDYSGITMKLDEFSTIVKYSFGLAKRTMNYNGITATTRYYASGGGLYPIYPYFLINKVKGIKKGLYRYQPYTHSLYPIDGDMKIEQLLQYGNFDFDDYCFCVLYEYDFDRNYLKYGELSLLTTLVEIGIMSHNFEIMCTALDYSACQIAGFDKQYAEKCIGLDGINSHILFTNICGKE